MNDRLIHNLARRSDMLRAVRDFFYDGKFIEVQTPVKITAPAPEEYIEAVCAESDFLRTSPELEMKELLSLRAGKIFQIGSCFRANERGRKHLEEFTMLEYYAAGWNYRELAAFTAQMLARTAERVTGSAKIRYQGRLLDLASVEYVTVEEAFQRYAGVSGFAADRDNTFDEVMVTKVEPQLGRNGLTFLMDYPASRASLSRLSAADRRVAERWEVYAAGIELGNAFGELTDAVEQKARFHASAAFRASQGMHRYPEPTEFFAALERGLPESSGCAIGLDRVAMLLCDAYEITEVAFSHRDTLVQP